MDGQDLSLSKKTPVTPVVLVPRSFSIVKPLLRVIPLLCSDSFVYDHSQFV